MFAILVNPLLCSRKFLYVFTSFHNSFLNKYFDLLSKLLIFCKSVAF